LVWRRNSRTINWN